MDGRDKPGMTPDEFTAAAASPTARGAGCHSLPVAAEVGKISDLITTGTAPDAGSMVPMSM